MCDTCTLEARLVCGLQVITTQPSVSPAKAWSPESERVHARIKDNTINKIYNITNNAVGSSLILTWTYYAECRFVLPGHFGVFIGIQHTEAKNARRNPRLQGYHGQDKVSPKVK